MILAALALATSPVLDPGLLPILSAMRRELREPRSVADLQVCLPDHLRHDKAGNLTGYTVTMSFSARNGLGGYTGKQLWYAIVRDGRARLVRSQLGEDGLDGAVSAGLRRRVEDCRWVSPAELDAGWGQLYSTPGGR